MNNEKPDDKKPTTNPATVDPAQADTAKPVKRPSGSSARRSIRRKPTTQQELAAANRASRSKSADTTRRHADLSLAKIELAGKFADVASRCLHALGKLSDEELAKLAKEKPVPIAVIAGICTQNLERLAAKAQCAPLVNIDLGAMAKILEHEREREREKRALKSELDALEEELQRRGVPQSVIDAAMSGEEKTLAAGSESAEAQA